MFEIESDQDWKDFQEKQETRLLLVTKQACGICRMIKNDLKKKPLDIPIFTIDRSDVPSFIQHFNIRQYPSICLFKGSLHKYW